MADTKVYAYRGARWRSRVAALGASLVAALSGAAVVWICVVTVRGLLRPAAGETVGGLLLGWVLAMAVVLLILWQAVLAGCNVLLATAAFRLEPDALTVLLAGRWPVTLRRADVDGAGGIQVMHRLGRPTRRKGPIIRPRRRWPEATFVPVRRVRGWHFVFWAAARMYAGRRARYGVLVTPDHEQHEDLLVRLGGGYPGGAGS
jgi:hypothetical protein